jgi:hypothetical protein
MFGTYVHKFFLPNGRQVFVPSESTRKAGSVVHAAILRRWRVPHHFYHLRSGGHLAAIKAHLHNRCFSTLDISGFFDSVARSKIYRALRSIGIDRQNAWEIAQQSTVEKMPGSFSLPYGFVQSPVLASLALDRSVLGRQIAVLARSNQVRLSCYVDDLVLSGVEQCAVEDGRLALIEAARQSNFVINTTKSQLPGRQITVFNIVLSNGEMALTADRMYKFEKDLIHGTQPAAEAILAYARSVNSTQANDLANQLAAGDGIP